MLTLGDWTSYYLALLYRVDPTPVPAIEELKQVLGRAASEPRPALGCRPAGRHLTVDDPRCVDRRRLAAAIAGDAGGYDAAVLPAGGTAARRDRSGRCPASRPFSGPLFAP